jgi:hypothetical protein
LADDILLVDWSEVTWPSAVSWRIGVGVP